jgi:hypothetical protein
MTILQIRINTNLNIIISYTLEIELFLMGTY